MNRGQWKNARARVSVSPASIARIPAINKRLISQLYGTNLTACRYSPRRALPHENRGNLSPGEEKNVRAEKSCSQRERCGSPCRPIGRANHGLPVGERVKEEITCSARGKDFDFKLSKIQSGMCGEVDAPWWEPICQLQLSRRRLLAQTFGAKRGKEGLLVSMVQGLF